MSECDSLADIVAEMRKRKEMLITAIQSTALCNSTERMEAQADILDEFADRIKAAWKRERAEIEANALAVGGIVEAARHKRGNAAAWKETCAKCMDGEIEPRHCEYYGEPNGCNSPTYGEHPTTEKSSAVGNAAAMREALNKVGNAAAWIAESCNDQQTAKYMNDIIAIVQSALSAPPRKGKWENGTMYEYEYAYCSECGRMQWAGWDTHKQADEEIGSFARDYKFCPGCGAEMEGGVYVY